MRLGVRLSEIFALLDASLPPLLSSSTLNSLDRFRGFRAMLPPKVTYTRDGEQKEGYLPDIVEGDIVQKSCT